MCTYPFAKKALTLYLARGKGRERYFGCNLMQRKVLASSHQHLMAEAPHRGGQAPAGEVLLATVLDEAPGDVVAERCPFFFLVGSASAGPRSRRRACLPVGNGLRGPSSCVSSVWQPTGDFCQEFPAKRLTLYREPTSLVVCEAKLLPAKPSFEDSVLLEQVDHSGLLVTLEPTSDGDD